MNLYAGLLRAVNLPGHNAITMAALREFLDELGLADARTLLASGNFVARAVERDGAALERRLEREAAKRLDLETDFHVRSPAEWQALVASNPFPREAGSDPGRLLVVFMRTAPTAGAVKRLEGAIVGREKVAARGRHLFAYYPDGAGRSKLTNALIARHLGAPGTARNWNTVMKLQALLEPR